MNDSDPRPMPPQVLAAYRDPINLSSLFECGLLTYNEQDKVRDDLLRLLVARHGNVYVDVKNKTYSIRARVAHFARSSAWVGIDAMMQVQEYGGKEGVARALAEVMQPFWNRWWDNMVVAHESTTSSTSFVDCASSVLGHRQLRWLSAQYARHALPIVDKQKDLDACVAAIGAAEEYADNPSGKTLAEMEAALALLSKRLKAYRTSAGESNPSALYRVEAMNAVAVACSVLREESSPDSMFDAARMAESAAHSVAGALSFRAYCSYYGMVGSRSAGPASDQLTVYRRAYDYINELTKQLITPTLITHASGALR